MAAGTHPFPFRTRQLRPPAPMVLGGIPPGRVGRRRVFSLRKKTPAHCGGRLRVLCISPTERIHCDRSETAPSERRSKARLERPECPQRRPTAGARRQPAPARRTRRGRTQARHERPLGGPGWGQARRTPARRPRRRTQAHVRSDGAPRREPRAGGAPQRATRSDGTPRRPPRRAGAPKRDDRGTGSGAPPRAGRSTGGRTTGGRSTGGSNREMRRDGPQKRVSRGGTSARAGRAGADRKRTSKNTDDRNPTHSSVDYPSAKYRRKNEEAPAPVPDRAAVAAQGPSARPPPNRPVRRRARKAPPVSPTRRRKVRTTEAGDELGRIAGRNARHAQAELARAAEAFTAGRERDAARYLRPLRDAYPDASAVRELLGLCQYRLGQYAAATKELEAFVELTNSVEQHPVLMDCARALGKHRRVDELWEELAAASPSGALVTEGRIVLAGSRADQGRLTEAIATLDRRGGNPNRVQDHHMRVWYALGRPLRARRRPAQGARVVPARSAAMTRASPTSPSGSRRWADRYCHTRPVRCVRLPR